MFIELEEPLAVVEGDSVNVCATLTLLGATTALECNITVYMDTSNGKAGRQRVLLQVMSMLCHSLNSFQNLVLTLPILQCSPSSLTLVLVMALLSV